MFTTACTTISAIGLRCKLVRLLGPLTFVLALLAPSAAMAKQTAEGFVRAKQSELRTLLRQDTTMAQKRIEAVFDQMLDYESLARESLAKHWDKRSEKEREEFESILKELVQRAYRKNLDTTNDYAVDFKGEAKSKDRYVVKTVARSKTDAREEPISIDYVVTRVDGRWKIQDIITEGSSLVNNYKRQFGRIIRKDGFSELVTRMKRKLAEEKDG